MALLDRSASRPFVVFAVLTFAIGSAAAIACNSKTDDVPLADITGSTNPPGSTSGSGTGASGDASFGDGDVVSIVDGSFEGSADDASAVLFSSFTCAGTPVALTANGNALYASCSTGEIVSIASNGGSSAITTLTRGGALAAVGNALYAVVPSSTAAAADGSILSIDLTTHAQSTLASSLVGPSSLVTSANGAVWVDGASGMVNVIADDVASGTLSTLNTFASGRSPGLLYLDGATVVFTDSTTGAGDIYLGSGNGNAATLLASTTGAPNALAADATNLYFTTSGTAGTVNSVALAGSAVKILSSVESSPVGLQLIGDVLYWVNATTGTLQTYNLTSSAESTIGGGFTNAVATVVSDGLYILVASNATGTNATGSVVRVAF